MSYLESVLQAVTPQVYQRFLQAVSLGRWPDGRKLTEAQRATCMEAIIAYEARHLPPEARTGVVPPKPTACAPDSAGPIVIRDLPQD